MTTDEFINRLRVTPGKQLVFTNSDGTTIHRGYHLTELKAASFDTVDCGAQKDRWNEMIVQLWVPEDENLPRIFGRFYRADKARSSEKVRGTGLGLAIVKHIAQLHGGRVEAESELEKGTTTPVFLP